MKSLLKNRLTAIGFIALLAVVKYKPIQWLWNWLASKLKLNIWAMRNVAGKMCLWKANLGEPTWEKLA